MITEEGNPFIIQYKEQCEVLIKEYNKKALSDEEKLLEYLQAMKANGNNTILQSSKLLFSDGTKMGIYWCSKTKNKIQLIYAWVSKEFKNLKRLYNAGVNVPEPYISANNVLIIEFIGDEKGNPAQPVRNQPPKNPEEFFNKLLVQLKKFVHEGKLVHGDLSNYNILNQNEEPVIIDV